MLKKKNRFLGGFTERPEFITSPLLSIKIAKNPKSEKRFSFVVSKKIDKRAVGRNRVKRLLSSSIEELLDKITFVDAIFYPKKEILGKDRKQIIDEIKNVFTENKLIK